MSTADFLFTPTVQRVLALALAQPERTFTLQELLDRAGGGHGGAQKQIDKLLNAGVLSEESKQGRQRRIRANTSFFLYPELRAIARKSFALAEPLRNALKPFESQIKEAFVFGSVAKEKDTFRSDVDLVVVGTANLFALNEALQQVERDLGRPIHLSLYGPDEWERLKNTDPVVAQIDAGDKMRLIPHD